MGGKGRLSTNTIFELEEMLVREKTLSLNSRFLQKLPDKGAKIKEKIKTIEEELISRKLEANKLNQVQLKRAEIEKLEWNLQSLTVNENNSPELPESHSVDTTQEDEEEIVLRMLANSQISQNQPKTVHTDQDNKTENDCPLYIKMLENTIENKSTKTRFVPNRTINSSASDADATNANIPSPQSASSLSSPPGPSNASSSKHSRESHSSISDSEIIKNERKRCKWDESLLPPTQTFRSVRPLSIKESFQLNADQWKKLKEQNRTLETKGRKLVTAYDAIMESAASGTASWIFRSPKPDKMNDEMDLDESDISDDDWVSSDRDSSADESDGGSLSRLTEIINSSLRLSKNL